MDFCYHFQLPYTIKTETSNEAALPTPKLNISNSGIIPKSTETFAVSLQCSGAVEEEVAITITINVTVSPENVTTLIFRRTKICLQYEKSATYISMDTVPRFSNSAHIFYIAVCCAALLIVLLTIMITLYYVKDRKSHRTGGNATTTTTFLAALPRNSANASSYGSFRRMPSYSLIDERSKDLQDKIVELSVQR